MAASQSLAQSIFKPGVQRAAGVPATAPAPRRKATLADVAERAGVSTSTASRALNGHAGLAPATRAAVEDAAAILNFQPSALARSLRTQQTFTVGFVVPDVSSPFYAAALKGAQGRLETGGLPRDAHGRESGRRA